MSECSYQLWGRHREAGSKCNKNQADCMGGLGQGHSVRPHRPPRAPSAPPPRRKNQTYSHVSYADVFKNIIKLQVIVKQNCDTFCSSWSFRVFVQSNWNTMCPANVCLMQRTTYSVSASVSCTGSEDLNSGPRPWNSGMAASCSGNDVNKNRCKTKQGFYQLHRNDHKGERTSPIIAKQQMLFIYPDKCPGVMGPAFLEACL